MRNDVANCVCVCVPPSLVFAVCAWRIVTKYRHNGTSAGEEAAFINYDDIMRVFASQPLSAAVEHKVSDIEAAGALLCAYSTVHGLFAIDHGNRGRYAPDKA